MSATLPYNNTTASGWKEATQQAGLLTNYAVRTDTSSRKVLGNRTGTSNLDQDIIVIQHDTLSKGVLYPSELTVEFPAKSKKAAMATIATWTVVTEPASDPMPRQDFPTGFSLQIRSSLSGTLDNTVLNSLWTHFLSSLRRNSDGTIDFRSYLLGATVPTADNVEPSP
jgi:hypothetical protein